jgi:membrane protein
LIGYSVSITARLQNSDFAASILDRLPFGVGNLLIAVSTTLATCLVFIISYYVMPNTRVRLRAALLGGVVAGVLWNLSKAIFIKATASSLKASTVYGALGALPMLMLWIYLSWLIVLFGAAYTYANQSLRAGHLDLTGRPLSPAFAERLAARLLLLVAARFRAGGPPLDAEALAEQAGTLGAAVRRVLVALVGAGILAETPGRKRQTAYLPGKDPATLDLAQVREAVRAEGTSFELAEEPAMIRLDATLAEAEAAARAVLERARPAHEAAMDV